MTKTILHLFATAACRHPWLVLCGATLLAVASVVYAALELRLNADTDDLIAPDRPYMGEYRALLDEFGDLEHIFAVIEAPAGDGADRAAPQAAADYIGGRLREIAAVSDRLAGVYWRIDVDEQLRLATRAMDDEALRELAEVARALPLLQPGAGAGPALIGAIERLDEAMRLGRGDTEQRAQLAREAVFLLAAVASALPDSVARDAVAPLVGETLEPEYLRSESGALYFIAIVSPKDFGTLAIIEEPLGIIRGVLNEARREFPGLAIGLTGKPVLHADEMRTSQRDMTRASIIAVALVAALIMLVMAAVWHPALTVLALLYGIAWTFGLTTLVIGQLNLLSIVFTLVLVGIGIDFGIHLVTRYREERAGMDIEQAIRKALLTSGRGNVTGAITSAIAFYMALLTDFQGLRELGFIAGSGLLLCLISMCLVLPSLLVVFDRRFATTSDPLRQADGKSARRDEHLRTFDGAWHWLLARPRAVLLGAAALTLVLSPMLGRIGFQKNLLELQASGLDSVQWEHRILEDSGETWFGAVIVETQEEVLEITRRAAEYETIGRVRSVLDYIQLKTPQRQSLRAALHENRLHRPERGGRGEAPEWDMGTLRTAAQRLETLAAAAEARGDQGPQSRSNAIGVPSKRNASRSGTPDAAQAGYLRALAGDLRRLADETPPLPTASALAAAAHPVEVHINRLGESISIMLEGDRLPLREALPAAVRGEFISERGRYMVTLHPVENVWQFRPMQRFVAELRQVDRRATGVPITQYESLIEMREGFQRAALLALLAVFVVLMIDLRSLRDALLTIAPLAIGMIWLVEAMGLLGVRFNLANFFAVPILIGISVDSGIHIMRRYREMGNGVGALGATRRAVFLTSMTSLIGFGCLATASHRGLQSLGIVMSIGAAAMLAASLIILPAILAWMKHPGRAKR